MIKIEFPADRADIALAIGHALVNIGTGRAAHQSPDTSTVTHADPFYWVHHESGAHGSVRTWSEMEELFDKEPLVEHVNRAVYDKFLAEYATPPKAETAPSVTDQTGAGEGLADADGASSATETPEVDEKGVRFNAEYCAKAQVPFYTTGPKRGQWKARRGVSEDAYDQWYADALFSRPRAEEAPSPVETTSDSGAAAAAFGAAQQQADTTVPRDIGALMRWVSEQQANNKLTQADVTQAYVTLSLPFDALVNPAKHDTAANCAAMYNHLRGQLK